ncbi:hypothetical protein [uncultured Flavobacterium sp.]|jgi:hypothetical protein|uniref:hypothetical protein n=1 Tax=uncultured Flavobacterium sp. TaxID=165435 RepID=UPI0030CA45E2
MGNIIYILFAIFLGTNSFYAQTFKELLLNKTEMKNRFTLIEEISIIKIVIPFNYNRATTDFDPSKLLKIPYRNIQKIEYIYSENRDIEHQNKLNSERIDTLTVLFKNRICRIRNNIELLTIAQTQKENKTELFNGFVITIEKSSRSNSDLIKTIINTPQTNKNQSCFNLDTLSDYGYILPHIQADYSGYEYKTINKVFDRNTDWKNKLVVVDVTGSMTPYLAQYLLWLRLNFNKEEKQNFVFFNDGNGFKNTIKPIGKTGGLYFTENNLGYNHLIKTITKAIVNGNCNYEIQENDIEAIIGGLQKFPDSKSIILIADNNASPRDIKLMKKLDVPIKVILCGTNNHIINQAYLDLAYKTKGSIHTIEDDLTDLIDLKEGSSFKFFGKSYQIKDGEIILVKSENT